MENINGIYTLAKFHRNADLESPNKVVTRTLGKFGFIDRNYKGTLPKFEEFWIVKIKYNIKPEDTQGCLILEPIRKVDYKNEVGKLVWGMYSIENVGKAVALIYPNEEFNNRLWQLPLEERKKFKKKSVIVVQNTDAIYNSVYNNIGEDNSNEDYEDYDD